jgi:penicillin-binding protein 1A
MSDIKPIRTNADHEAALAEIEALFDAQPGTAEADRLEVLTILVSAWEARNFPLNDADPIDALTFAMKAQGRSQSDFAGVLKSRSRASEILNRRRPLTADMIDAISRAWSIPAAALGGLPRTAQSSLRRLALRGSAALALLVALGLAGGGGAMWFAAKGLPGIDQIEAIADQPGYVPLTEIPPHVVKAFLAAEDKDFYGHGGVSTLGVLRAAALDLTGLMNGHKRVGGTGISEQVAKNLLLHDEPRSLSRRLKEAILAERLETALSKDRILEIYLNKVYLGDECHGVAEASRHYFGKPLESATVAEAAVMAGLPRAPNAYRPNLQDHAKAKARRDWVLERMATDGLITVSAAHLAQAEQLVQEQ